MNAFPEDQRPPLRVVVAEDSFLIRELLTQMLDASPEVELVEACSNGKELLASVAHLIRT